MSFKRHLIAAAALGAVGLAGAAAEAQSFFRIGTGTAAGTYYPVGGIMATAISNPPGSRPCDKGGSCGVPGLIAVVQSSDGSVANVNAIVSGQMESGISQSDVAHWAYTGTGLFEGKPKAEKIRVIANLFPEHIHLITSAKANFASPAALKGKAVNMGLPASGTLVGARLLFEAYGLKEGDLKPEYLSPAQSVDRIRDGQMDASFLIAGYPVGAMVELAASGGGGLIPIAPDMQEKIVKAVPYWSKETIPAGTYKGVDKDTPTVAVGAQWLTSADQPAELIYNITKALWNENTRKLLDNGHAKGKSILQANALAGVSLPLHPGAERFYKEVGLLK